MLSPSHSVVAWIHVHLHLHVHVHVHLLVHVHVGSYIESDCEVSIWDVIKTMCVSVCVRECVCVSVSVCVTSALPCPSI